MRKYKDFSRLSLVYAALQYVKGYEHLVLTQRASPETYRVLISMVHATCSIMQSPQPAHPVGCTLFRNHKQSNGYDDPKMKEVGERKFGLMFRGSRLSSSSFVIPQKHDTPWK